MPRRLITSEIFRNEKFGDLDDSGRVFFIGCFSNADDDGRLKASPKYLKALLFPYDNDKTPEYIQELRTLCHQLGLIHVYSQNGTDYLYCIGWEEHQVIRKDRHRPSVLPPPNTLMPTTRQPDDNQVSVSCPTDDSPNLIQSNPIKDNIKDDKKISSPIGEKVKEVFGELDKIRGYRPPKRKAEAASIIRMLKIYIPSQILATYRVLKEDKFWQGKELFMMSVESQIGAMLKDGAHQSKPGKIPTKYTRPEELLH